METQLVHHLMTLAERYGAARCLEEATVGRHCAADGRFFLRLREGKTFTAKKYDEVVGWFSRNWPDDVEWPPEVLRPTHLVEAAE
ncbi:hypothetical protein ABID21_000685 [Pseudorhizobium tarimense]|uniref:Uncharacterized protein n=1 Tax=Pseudorhizobium tarimense TaxID=1079109 RepID=A0ABV2H221_9HYPH|nr:hypothetical protein [Pseudorhizobium tarimense]MCJ8517800.1 hypothetical protein [Pseudorhizobium tarimense]